MAKTSFALFTCDLHKTRDSHRYIGNATSPTKVRMAVKQLLKNNVIENNTGMELKEMDIKDFQELDYFSFVEVENNEIEVTGSYYV